MTPSSSGTSLPGGGGGGTAGRTEGNKGKAGDKGAPSDDIIFVKRRSKDHTVVLTAEEEANVRWKETLYLNVIVQLHCELTVAVCTKTVHPDGRSSMHALNHTTKRVYASPSKTRMDKKGAWAAHAPTSTPNVLIYVHTLETRHCLRAWR